MISDVWSESWFKTLVSDLSLRLKSETLVSDFSLRLKSNLNSVSNQVLAAQIKLWPETKVSDFGLSER